MLVLQLEPDLVSNTYAKQIFGSFDSKQEFFPTLQSRQTGRGTSKSTTTAKEKKNKTTNQIKTNQKKWSSLVFCEKNLEQLYSRGPATYRSSKRLQKHSKLSLAKINAYLDTKPFFTKYRSIRMQFPRLKVIVKDISEIWSLDLAFVDNLANFNRDVKNLLVAVDCLSQYLRVEPMKTKYATDQTK